MSFNKVQRLRVKALHGVGLGGEGVMEGASGKGRTTLRKTSHLLDYFRYPCIHIKGLLFLNNAL